MKTADFSAWLLAKQQAALEGMRSTTGAEFGQHAEAFANLAAATTVLLAFEAETDTAKGGAA